jgi:hypothetical protein
MSSHEVKKGRLGMIVSAGAVVLLLVGGMLLFHGMRERRESELMERLSRLEALIGGSTNWVAQARAERLVTPEDLPIFVRWLGREYRSDWLKKLEALYRSLDREKDYVDGSYAFKATRGFVILGTNAAPAIPPLVQFLRRGNDPEIAIQALGAIGEPVWETAVHFTKSESPGERMCGAYLLGVLRMNSEVSVPTLLRLQEEKESGIRASALVALAEFPTDETLAFFSEMLRSDDRATFSAGAYGLHQGGKEAMRLLVERFDSTTNSWIHETILRAVFARESNWRARKQGTPRSWEYQWKHGYMFTASHNEVTIFLDTGSAAELMGAIRDKLLKGEETNLTEEMEKLRGAGARPNE